MELEIFMIHLCTIATLMFLQNNTSQKILFIAARTIQFPGVVFKVCIYLIVAIVTSSLYFDVKSTHTYSKIQISAISDKMIFIKLSYKILIKYENKGWELHPRQHPNIFHGELGSRYRKPTSTAVRTKRSVFIFFLSHYYKTGFIISYLVS